MSSNTSIKMEKSLLGAVLIYSKSIFKYMNYLNINLFTDKKNRLIFKNIEILLEIVKGNKIEISLLVDYLEKENGYQDFNWFSYISDIFDDACDENNIITLSHRLSELAQLRVLDKTMSEIQQDIRNAKNSDANEIIGTIEEKIFRATRDRKIKDFESIKDISKKTVKKIIQKVSNKETSGISSGFKNLDKLTSGFQKSDLIILAARPSMGKTALALNIASHAGIEKHVAFISLEMSSEQLAQRLLGTASFIDFSLLKNPSKMKNPDWVKLSSGEEKVSKLKIKIDDTAGLLLGELIWKIRKLNKIQKIDLVIIDYLQLITIKNSYSTDNRQMEVSTISRSLKFLAKELNVPIIALSQLSRKVEQRENKKPMMSDLRESGAIEQDADLIMFLYREDYYKAREEHEHRQDVSEAHESEIIIAKHRNGPIGRADLLFKPSIGLFSDLKKN